MEPALRGSLCGATFLGNILKVCPIIIVKGLSIHISILKGRSLDLQSSAESWVNFLSFGMC